MRTCWAYWAAPIIAQVLRDMEGKSEEEIRRATLTGAEAGQVIKELNETVRAAA